MINFCSFLSIYEPLFPFLDKIYLTFYKNLVLIGFVYFFVELSEKSVKKLRFRSIMMSYWPF